MTYGVYYIFCLILIATYSLAVSGKCLAKIKIFIFLLPPLFYLEMKQKLHKCKMLS